MVLKCLKRFQGKHLFESVVKSTKVVVFERTTVSRCNSTWNDPGVGSAYTSKKVSRGLESRHGGKMDRCQMEQRLIIMSHGGVQLALHTAFVIPEPIGTEK